MNSLQKQLQLGLALGLVLLLGLLWWGGSFAVRSLTEDFVASRLEHDVERLLASMRFEDTKEPKVRWRRINDIYHQPFSGHYYQIIFPDGQKLTSRSLWDQQLEVPLFPPGSSAHWRMPGPSGQDLLVQVGGYSKQGKAFTLAVGEDMAQLDKDLALFQWVYSGLSLLIAFLLLFVQSLIVRRSMRRLVPVRDDIQRLGRGEITSLTEQVPLEVQPLVAEFNRLLGLLQQRLEHSRNGLGNLAHAFKGPLNLLVQRIDSRELDAFPELRASMNVQVKRIAQLMERELKRARLAGTGVAGEQFDTAEEIPALVGVLKQMYADKGVSVQYHLPKLPRLPLDREDMLELLGNLLDNACKWADSEVHFSIDKDGKVTFVIEDDGSGVSEDELTRLTERGVRVDESVDGHGLGLAISRDIVNRYGGEIIFGQAPELGGLRVEVSLPVG